MVTLGILPGKGRKPQLSCDIQFLVIDARRFGLGQGACHYGISRVLTPHPHPSSAHFLGGNCPQSLSCELHPFIKRGLSNLGPVPKRGLFPCPICHPIPTNVIYKHLL